MNSLLRPLASLLGWAALLAVSLWLLALYFHGNAPRLPEPPPRALDEPPP